MSQFNRSKHRRVAQSHRLQYEVLEKREMMDAALAASVAESLGDTHLDTAAIMASNYALLQTTTVEPISIGNGAISALNDDAIPVAARAASSSVYSGENLAVHDAAFAALPSSITGSAVGLDMAASELVVNQRLGGFLGGIFDGFGDFFDRWGNWVSDVWHGAEGALKNTIEMLEHPDQTVKQWVSIAKSLGHDPLGTGEKLVGGLLQGAASNPLQFIGSTLTNMATASIGSYLLPSLPPGTNELLAQGQRAVTYVGDAFENLVNTFAGAFTQNRLGETLHEVLGDLVDLGPRDSDNGCGIADFGLWVVPDKILGLDLSDACGYDHTAQGGIAIGHDSAFHVTAPVGVSVAENLANNLVANGQFFVDILKAGVEAAKDGHIVGAAISPAVAVVYTAAVTGVALGSATVQGVARLGDDVATILPFASMTHGLRSAASTVPDPLLRGTLINHASQLSVPQTRPAAPTELTVKNTGANRVTLKWNDNSGNERQFVVEISTDGGKHWNKQENVPARATSAIITKLKPGETYQFRVVAQNAIGRSKPSNVVTVTTRTKGDRPNAEKAVNVDDPFVGEAPQTPNNLHAVSVSATELQLAWEDVDSEQSYELFVSKDYGAMWEKQGEFASGQTSARIAVSSNMTYEFRVVAVNEYGASAPSNAVTVTTPTDEVLVLSSPKNLRVASISPREVEIHWDEVSGEEKYTVQVSTDGGTNWSKKEDVPADHAYSAKLSVEPGRTYHFRVVAVNRLGLSKPSNEVEVNTPDGKLPPVTGLRVVSNGPREVEVRWDESVGELNYTIQVSTDNGANWNKQEDVPANHADSTKLTVEPGRNYIFRVLAVNEFGASKPSNVIEVTTPDGLLEPVTGLRVVSVGPREVEVRWDESSGEDHYSVQVSTNGGTSWTKQEDVPADHAYSAKLTVEPGRNYIFRVVAVNEFGASRPSNVVEVTTPDGRPPVPNNLRTVAVGPREIEVRWDEVSGEDYYRVLVSTDGGSSWTKQEDVPADHAYSAKLTVSPNRNYQFKVVTINGYGASESSNVLQVRSLGEPPAAPENLRLVAKRTNEVEVKWSEVSGEDKYTVQVSTDNGNTWRKQEDVPADHAYSARLSVTNGHTYWFRVIAVNEFGHSLPSNVLRVDL